VVLAGTVGIENGPLQVGRDVGERVRILAAGRGGLRFADYRGAFRLRAADDDLVGRLPIVGRENPPTAAGADVMEAVAAGDDAGRLSSAGLSIPRAGAAKSWE
jgi:hypothetical protein